MSETELTIDEKSDFSELHNAVRSGMDSFLEVANALWQIQDRKLYRGEFTSFESYCKESHDLTRPSVYRMIQCAKVEQKLSPIGDSLPATESQYRELSSVPEESQAAVWEEVVEKSEIENAPITASMVKEVADPYKDPKPEKKTRKNALSKPGPVEEESKPSPLIELRDAVSEIMERTPIGSKHAAGLMLIEIGEGIIE